MSLTTSLIPPTAATSETKTVTASTSHSSIFSGTGSANTLTSPVPRSAVITVNTDTYFRMTTGATDTVAADGTDMLLLANQMYRFKPIPNGFYLHFIRKSADGNVYITPDA